MGQLQEQGQHTAHHVLRAHQGGHTGECGGCRLPGLLAGIVEEGADEGQEGGGEEGVALLPATPHAALCHGAHLLHHGTPQDDLGVTGQGKDDGYKVLPGAGEAED